MKHVTLLVHFYLSIFLSHNSTLRGHPSYIPGNDLCPTKCSFSSQLTFLKILTRSSSCCPVMLPIRHLSLGRALSPKWELSAIWKEDTSHRAASIQNDNKQTLPNQNHRRNFFFTTTKESCETCMLIEVSFQIMPLFCGWVQVFSRQASGGSAPST